MPKPIDTHAHLYAEAFQADRTEVLNRAKSTLEAVFLPNIDKQSLGHMMDIADSDPGFFFPMIGLHPCHVGEYFEQELDVLELFLHQNPARLYGIGETGLDLYWDKTTLERQIEALERQIDWAMAYRLPIILHARDAIDQTLEVIQRHWTPDLRGIFHCFDGTPEQASKILEMGTFKLGIGGIVTYRKDVQEMVAALPHHGVVLETDSPYLPPEPHRKSKHRRNESAYTVLVAEKIADLWNISYDEATATTNRNAKDIFHNAPVKTVS